MNISWYERDDLLNVAAEKILPTYIVLDVGAGIRPQTFFTPTVHLIIEPYVPYIEKALNQPGQIPRKVFLNGTWDKVMPFFLDKSIDTIFAIDVIEHLEKAEGIRFLKESERIAKSQIAIFTPWGLYPQFYDSENDIDRWGMDGGYWQSHRSGWEPKDFEGEWEFLACKDFHLTDQHGETMEQPFGAFWAIKTIENKTAPIENRHYVPELSATFLLNYLYKRIVTVAKKRLARKFSQLANSAKK